MSVYILAWAMIAVALTRMLVLAAVHLRSALPSREAGSSDVTMIILFTVLAPRGLGESLVVTSIVNPGPRPVLAGLSVRRRRCPAWLGQRLGTRVARRTARRWYRAGGQATIGIVPAGGTSVLPVRFVAIRRRYRVIAVIGQSDDRLRVISMPLARRPEGGTGPSDAAITGLFPG